jgi:hypothetical protein
MRVRQDPLAIYERLPGWTSDWHRFRRLLLRLLPPPRQRESIGSSYPVRREFGGWAVRPSRGWRQYRWVTPPLHFTRSIPAGNEDAATDWALERMGM